jgi:DNA-binding response OmpR family regulator
MRVLVVEDEPKTAEFIRTALTEAGFSVETVDDGHAVLGVLGAATFDLAVLDVMLPGCDGLQIVRQLRAKNHRLPVLLLSARGEVNEKVDGLNAGADDYLPKPFALEELLARVRALLRRGQENRDLVLRVADLALDTTSRIAHRGARKIELTNREFRLLEYLMRSAGRVCTRMMILEKVWEYHFDPGTNVVDVYIRKLREKVDGEGEHKLLHSVRGEGYTLREIK